MEPFGVRWNLFRGSIESSAGSIEPFWGGRRFQGTVLKFALARQDKAHNPNDFWPKMARLGPLFAPPPPPREMRVTSLQSWFRLGPTKFMLQEYYVLLPPLTLSCRAGEPLVSGFERLWPLWRLAKRLVTTVLQSRILNSQPAQSEFSLFSCNAKHQLLGLVLVLVLLLLLLLLLRLLSSAATTATTATTTTATTTTTTTTTTMT